MIKINTLFRCENVKDIYYLDGYDVINIVTGHKKALTKSKQTGYPYVTLEQYGKTTPKKVLMHHIIALAYIQNKPYEVIEHLNDNRSDYRVENLKFSTHLENSRSAIKNGCFKPRNEKIVKVIMQDGTFHTGTIKNLSKKLDIPRPTIYDHLYFPKENGELIKSVAEVSQQTIERVSDA